MYLLNEPKTETEWTKSTTIESVVSRRKDENEREKKKRDINDARHLAAFCVHTTDIITLLNSQFSKLNDNIRRRRKEVRNVVVAPQHDNIDYHSLHMFSVQFDIKMKTLKWFSQKKNKKKIDRQLSS